MGNLTSGEFIYEPTHPEYTLAFQSVIFYGADFLDDFPTHNAELRAKESTRTVSAREGNGVSSMGYSLVIPADSRDGDKVKDPESGVTFVVSNGGTAAVKTGK